MKFHPILRGAAVLTAAVLALSACARSEEGTDPAPRDDQSTDNPVQAGYFPQDGDAAEPSRGGTLTYADLSEVRSLDPTQVIPTGSSGATAWSRCTTSWCATTPPPANTSHGWPNRSSRTRTTPNGRSPSVRTSPSPTAPHWTPTQ